MELEGPEPYSARDAAAAAARAVGREVAPVVPPREAWVETLTGAGLGRPYAELLDWATGGPMPGALAALVPSSSADRRESRGPLSGEARMVEPR